MIDNYAELSDLEREFELEMETTTEGEFEMEFEAGDDSFDQEFEAYGTSFEQEDIDQEFEAFETSFEQEDIDQEFEAAFEQDVSGEYEFGYSGGRSGEFVERLMEIGSRQFETPYEAEAAMSEVLDDIEREYFFGAIKRGLKKLSKNKLLRSLAKKGLTMGVNKFFPGLKGALQLARGNVKGALMNFGKQALGSVVPGGGAVLDAVQTIGLQPAGGGEAQERETWENYVELSREAYEQLAETLTPTAHQPAEAMRLANNAVQHAVRRARSRTAGSGRGAGHRRGQGRLVRLRVSPGERLKVLVVGA